MIMMTDLLDILNYNTLQQLKIQIYSTMSQNLADEDYERGHKVIENGPKQNQRQNKDQVENSHQYLNSQAQNKYEPDIEKYLSHQYSSENKTSSTSNEKTKRQRPKRSCKNKSNYNSQICLKLESRSRKIKKYPKVKFQKSHKTLLSNFYKQIFKKRYYKNKSLKQVISEYMKKQYEFPKTFGRDKIQNQMKNLTSKKSYLILMFRLNKYKANQFINGILNLIKEYLKNLLKIIQNIYHHQSTHVQWQNQHEQWWKLMKKQNSLIQKYAQCTNYGKAEQILSDQKLKIYQKQYDLNNLLVQLKKNSASYFRDQ